MEHFRCNLYANSHLSLLAVPIIAQKIAHDKKNLREDSSGSILLESLDSLLTLRIIQPRCAGQGSSTLTTRARKKAGENLVETKISNSLDKKNALSIIKKLSTTAI
jgi:DNA gyrase/topoisomerase IV subunit B